MKISKNYNNQKTANKRKINCAFLNKFKLLKFNYLIENNKLRIFLKDFYSYDELNTMALKISAQMF